MILQEISILYYLWQLLKKPNGQNAPKDFEDKLSRFLKMPHVISVGSGTDALILSLKALGIGPGDEVIVPALSFYSSAGAVSWINAKPIFVDIEENTFNIDPNKIEAAITPRTKAIIAVHLNGHMADMEAISRIAKKYNLFVIEDAAQALGSKYKEKPIGYYGDLACLSFNPQKIINGIGDGGAVVTKSASLAEKIFLMRNYGANPKEPGHRHSIHGISSRLNPVQATILLYKLEGLEKKLEKRRRKYHLYSDLLRGVGDLLLPKATSDEEHNGYRFAIRTKKRDELHQYLKNLGIDSRIHYPIPLPHLGAFGAGRPRGEFPIAEAVADEILILPNEDNTREKDIEKISKAVAGFWS